MSYNALAFYITAHEDDWELFRGEQAYYDAHDPAHKIVFIHTTAGDAGLTDGWWEAREQGAVAAVRSALSPKPLTIHVQTFNGHPIQRFVCGNTVIYFMRLPDGNPGGTGYPATGYKSLSQLRDSNKAIAAVDSSTSYKSWNDFCGTLSQVVKFECKGVSLDHPWINASDYCATTNPGDHADHTATSDAVRSFAAPRFNRAWFLTYCTSGWPANLSGADLANKKKTFDAYGKKVKQMTTLDGRPVQPNQQEWNDWGARSYVRLVEAPQPDIDDPTLHSGFRQFATFLDAASHPTHARPPRKG